MLDEASGVRRCVTLAMPQVADIEAGQVSIMTPVGSGLIGMSEGHAISWTSADGRSRMLKIIAVRQRA